MKRFLLLFLLLALLLSLTGCFTITGDTTDTSPEGKQEAPEEQHLTADVDETQVWQRTAGAPWTPRPSVPTLSALVARRPRA